MLTDCMELTSDIVVDSGRCTGSVLKFEAMSDVLFELIFVVIVGAGGALKLKSSSMRIFFKNIGLDSQYLLFNRSRKF